MNAFLDTLKQKKFMLIMSMPVNDAPLARDAFEAGADVVKVHMNLTHRAGGTLFGDLAENRACFETMLSEAKGPMGLVPGGSAEAAGKDLIEASRMGFSFLSVYAHHMPVWGMKHAPAVMTAADCSYTTEEIAAFKACGADVLEASVIPGAEYGTPLTMRDVIRYRNITAAVDLPVVVPTQRAVRPDEVRALYEAGVNALMIGSIVTGKTRETILPAIEAFRTAIDRL